MDATPLEILRLPHPNQAQVDRWAAETLRKTAGTNSRHDADLRNPRHGLVPALRKPGTPIETKTP